MVECGAHEAEKRPRVVCMPSKVALPTHVSGKALGGRAGITKFKVRQSGLRLLETTWSVRIALG